MEDRKAFKFYRSYYDVAKKLPEEERIGFLWAIIEMQFTGKEPEELSLMADLAFTSQKHSILKQLEGYRHGFKGGRPPKGKQNQPLKGRSKQEQEKEQEQEQYVEEFERFWSKYPKKVAKGKCKDKFLKLKESEIETILNTIDKYINYKPFEDYTHPNPLTYLNQRRWEDEIPEEEKKPKTGADIYAENVMRQINANK